MARAIQGVYHFSMPRKAKTRPAGQTCATYLDTRDVKQLRRMARAEKTTVSALIREAVQATYELR